MDPTSADDQGAAPDAGGDFDTGQSAPDPTGQPAPDPSAAPAAPAGPTPRSVTTGPAGGQPFSQSPPGVDDSQVSPDEQKQYDDFVTRSLLFINDPRPPKNSSGKTRGDAKPPRDVIIDHLNAASGVPTEMALGRTAAQVAFMIANNAKFHNAEYPPDVIFHGTDEILSNLYDVGVASGVIQHPPQQGSEEEQKLLATAKMYAAKFYGDNMISSGQLTPDMRKQFYQYAQQEIAREGSQGHLDSWQPNMTHDQLIGVMSKLGNGQQLVKPTPSRSSISDFAASGHPSMTQGAGGGAAPPPSAPTDDSQGGG